MKNSRSNLVSYLVAVGLGVIGLAVVYYAFELVSVPHVREYNPGWMIIVGLMLAVGGAGLAIYTFRSGRQHKKMSASIETPTG